MFGRKKPSSKPPTKEELVDKKSSMVKASPSSLAKSKPKEQRLEQLPNEPAKASKTTHDMPPERPKMSSKEVQLRPVREEELKVKFLIFFGDISKRLKELKNGQISCSYMYMYV